ncbi:hypothetical protein Q9L58_004053 [Maublancomyces gigas]|uniref:Uncharacterized protein n=1 Tax=Discina gigas TaxID=1032678 RepID=A0ABR3GM09_9PEZI
MSTGNSSSSGKGWFILRFEDPERKLQMDILYLNNPRELIRVAANSLELVIFERFDRQGDLFSGDGFRIKNLSVIGPDAALPDLQVTFSQLVTYIRDLPPSPQASRPDLFGLGSNRVLVTFEYIEVGY